MAYQLFTLPLARRALKKLPKTVRQHLVNEVSTLAKNPHQHDVLEGQWRFLRSFHLVFKRTHYRVVYEINESKKQIYIHYAATRENFYRTLRRLKLKSQR